MGSKTHQFQNLTKEHHRELASKGGKKGHELGVAHEWTLEEARIAGRKGGLAAQRNRRLRENEQ